METHTKSAKELTLVKEYKNIMIFIDKHTFQLSGQSSDLENTTPGRLSREIGLVRHISVIFLTSVCGHIEDPKQHTLDR